MKLIIGKKWQEKTQYYIKKSLKENAIWLVEPNLKDEYERMLLEASENKAILLQRVMSFDELFNEQLHLQQIFNHQVVTPIQSLSIIYDILKSFNGEIICTCDNGTLAQLQDVFNIFNDYQTNLDNLEGVRLPAFSKKKLCECWQLYKLYQIRLKELGLVMKGDYQIDNLMIDLDVHFYIDQIEHFTKQMISLIKQLPNCSLLLTCDEQMDTYTCFAKKVLIELNGEIINFESPVSSFKNYLNNSYQNLKATAYNGDYSLKGIKAINQHHEIDFIAREIFHYIASGEATYTDFIVYCANDEYLEKVKNCFELHQLPCFVNKPVQVKQSKIQMLLKGLFMYAKTKEEEHIITIFRSHLYKGVFQDNLIDWYEKQIKTTKTCVQENYLVIKNEIDKLVNLLKMTKLVNEKAMILREWLTAMEVEKAAIDEINRSYLVQTVEYLEQFSLPIEMIHEDFLDFFMMHYQLQTPKLERTLDMIPITTNQSLFMQGKYIYILGCNEESFPKIGSDNKFILNNEIMACDKVGISLGLNLFEEIEREYLRWFKIFYMEKQLTLTYKTGSLGGDDFLPSSLYLNLLNQLNGKEKTINMNHNLTDVTNKKASLDIIINYDKQDEMIKKIHNLVQSYTHNKNQPSLVDIDLFNQLIVKNGKKAISPSELETFNGCPFKYYVRYGLGLYPWLDKTLKANDFGTIVHDVLDILSDLYRFDKTLQDYLIEFNITDIKDEYNQKIYPGISDSDLLNEEDQSLFLIIHHIATSKIDISELTRSQQYLFAKLQHDLFNTIKILIYQASISEFKLTEHEAWASKEWDEYIVQGRIDRVEQYQQYIKVVDYKSSQKALDLCLATLGFNIQMLLYLDMLCQDKAVEKGGVLYFNTKQRVVKMDKYLYEDQLDFEEIIELYKMEGYINSEETLIKAMDTQYDPSVIAKIKFVKSKGAYSGNLLNKEQFDSLIMKVNEHVQSMLVRIYQEGDIRILPSHHDAPNINMLVNPCTYCDYSAVCLKDVFYNENREIEYIDEKTMLKLLGGDAHD